MTGLRLQIVASLGVLSVLLSGLLGLTLLRVASGAVESSLEGHIATIQEAAGKSMGSMLKAGASGQHLDDMARYWLESGSIDGIWVFDGSGNLAMEFTRDDYRAVEVAPIKPTQTQSSDVTATGPGAAGSRFTQMPAGRGLGCVITGTDMERLTAPLGTVRGLIVLYLGLHVVMILAFGYFLLTLLIVRPIDRLRTAAVRLGEGRFDLQVDPGSGAKEVRDLAAALEQTASKLDAQRTALRTKIVELEKAKEEISSQQDAIIRTEKLASIGRLAAGVAHEIGNPLSVILGFLDLLQGSDLQENEKREYVDRMQGEAERMNRIIKNLLSYSRAEAGEVEAVDVEQVIGASLEVLAPQKIMRGIEVDLEVSPDARPVRATRDRLTQVVVNLLLNAAEAMVGEGRLGIIVDPDPAASETVIRIEDDGPGIDESIAPLIFEPFVTTKPESEGTGLGLSVCLSIVQELGGTLTARNREGSGACFELRLPAAEPGQ
jgi:signal transduction histidine kinase